MTCQIAYLNGEFLPLQQARVPVLDRGFLFADSVYEVIPVYAGQPFLLSAHLQRLAHSLTGIRLANPHSPSAWERLIGELIQRNGGGDIAVYLQVTRGAQPRREHPLPANPEPTIVAFCQARTPPDPRLLTHGIAAITRTDDRWQRCEIKSTALLPNILAADDAARAEAAEAILLRDGAVTEGASSNVFVVHGQRLATPALAPTVLPGITRAAVLRLARDHAIDVVETMLEHPDLISAEEIWLTSSTREIYPVTRLNGKPVGGGRPGPMWAKVRDLLRSEADVR